MASPLSRLGHLYAAPQWRFYMAGTVALIFTNIIVLEIPLLAKRIIDGMAAKQTLEQFTLVSLGIIGLGFTQVIIRSLSRILIFWPGRTLEASLKSDVFLSLLRAPIGRLLDFSTGDLTSRLNNDVTQLRIFFAFGALQVLNVIFISIFTVTKMASLDPTLTVLSISPMMVMLVLTKAVMPKLYVSMRENTEALGRLTGKVSEAFSQVHTIQTMNASSAITSRLEPDNTAIFQSNLRTIWLRTLTWPIMTVLIGVSQFAILTWGGKQIIAGSLTVGDIMAFNIYIGMLTFPFASLGIIMNVYQRAKPASERIESVKDIPPETSNIETGTKLTQKTTEDLLQVRNISFKWPNGRVALNDVSFTIKAQERIGIYGSIGSGKSTLFNIITKLYEPTSGQIFLRGIDTARLSPAVVRDKIAYAQQHPLLLSESIRSNLLLGCEDSDISMDRLTETAVRADILADIQKFPETWDTPIGERGIKLSGGQKQRLSLARVLLRPAEIIILDDVLSAVDHETEHRLIKSLLATKSALIIASHRVSILEPCDKILVFDAGRIIAEGTYGDVKHFIERRPTADHLTSPGGVT
jgi:ATP-binding cassette subfamily B multidrug efflux pump